jgi:hypothetical protein
MRHKNVILISALIAFALWGAIESKPAPNAQDNQKQVPQPEYDKPRRDNPPPSIAPNGPMSEIMPQREGNTPDHSRYYLWAVAWFAWVRSWVAHVIDEPPNFFAFMVAVFTYFLWDATSRLFIETAGLRKAADDQRADLLRSIEISEKTAAAAEQSAVAAIDQVSLSKEALITTERAFIYCERIHAIWTADKKTELVIKWTFQPFWKNSGKTPTKRARNKISWWVGIDAGDIPPNFDFTSTDNATPTMTGSDATMHGSRLDLNIETLQKIRIGAAHAYIWGWMDYNDIFAKTQRHRTEFCVEIQVIGNPIYKEGGFAYRMHGLFNGFDEDCYCKPKPY